jgi:hypothetical protein
MGGLRFFDCFVEWVSGFSFFGSWGGYLLFFSLRCEKGLTEFYLSVIFSPGFWVLFFILHSYVFFVGFSFGCFNQYGGIRALSLFVSGATIVRFLFFEGTSFSYFVSELVLHSTTKLLTDGKD